MYAGGRARSERGAFEFGADPLFVQRMAGLVQYREQGLADITLVDTGGDPYIAGRQSRTEWMMCLVQPPPVKVVSDALGYGQAEVELRRFVESASQAVVGDRRLSGDGTHDRYQGFSQRGKQAAHLRRRHAFIRDIDQRV